MVNTYQPINPTALAALALMRDQAEYRQVTISSTVVVRAGGRSRGTLTGRATAYLTNEAAAR